MPKATEISRDKYESGEIDVVPQRLNKFGGVGALMDFKTSKIYAYEFEYRSKYYLKKSYVLKLDKTDPEYARNLELYTYHLVKRSLRARARRESVPVSKDSVFVIYERKGRYTEVVLCI